MYIVYNTQPYKQNNIYKPLYYMTCTLLTIFMFIYKLCAHKATSFCSHNKKTKSDYFLFVWLKKLAESGVYTCMEVTILE